ncbi:MAG: TetR/AcrR family transcriptional regulator [Tumebacillaceae bacterium]
MPSKKELKSEETKRAIVSAAGQLFADRGYEAVTMREIAKAAGCSHTTIYIYYKDKEALLHQLSMAPLEELHGQMEAVMQHSSLTPQAKLRAVTRAFIHFCFLHRNLYNIFFMTKATRVDALEPELEVNRLRIRLFVLLRQAIQECLTAEPEERVLANARIYFFTLHGILGTYRTSEEPYDVLIERLAPTFDLAVDVLLAGFTHTAGKKI